MQTLEDLHGDPVVASIFAPARAWVRLFMPKRRTTLSCSAFPSSGWDEVINAAAICRGVMGGCAPGLFWAWLKLAARRKSGRMAARMCYV